MSQANALNTAIMRVISQAPQWIRADLISKDGALRTRAEEALAAMIEAALVEQADVPTGT